VGSLTGMVSRIQKSMEASRGALNSRIHSVITQGCLLTRIQGEQVGD